MTRIARVFWDRILAGGLLLAGVIVLFVGWYGASGSPYAEEQIPYLISAGFSALALIGLGATAWLSSDLRDEWYRLRELERVVGELALDRGGDAASTEPDAPQPEAHLANGRAPITPSGARR